MQSREVGAQYVELLETPVLAFRRYALAFHVAASPREGVSRLDRQGPHERAMESYEDDMLLYAHRNKPPFSTRVISVDAETVTVGFAPELIFESEGLCKRLSHAHTRAGPRRHEFVLTRAQTVFEGSDLAVLTVTLTPLVESSSASELHEFDVIKLIKLWEGGEGIGNNPSCIEEGRDLWFETDGSEKMTFHELVARVFPGWRPVELDEGRSGESAMSWRSGRFGRSRSRGVNRQASTAARDGFRVGTVELELAADIGDEQLFDHIAALKRSREGPAAREEWERVVAVGGILQGLLDFQAIETSELADVFADVDISAEDATMRAFHKGTLLSLTGESADDASEPDEERPSPIGVDPYLAVPNIVLLHDEERLRTARILEQDLAERQASRLLERATIHETENGLSRMARLTAQTLPNVFHYASERRLQKSGRHSRGLDDLDTFVRHRRDELNSVLESRVHRRDRWTAVIGLAVGAVIAVLAKQAIEGKPPWIIAITLALFGIFLWLRDFLF